MFKRSFFVLSVFLAFNGCGGTTAGTFPAEFVQKVTSAFQASMAKNGFPGGVLGLMRASDGAVMYVATGMAEAESISNPDMSQWVTKTAMTTAMHTRIASVSKPFTATVILILADQGLLALDQTIDDFFPGLVPNSTVITIRNLLNMASGLYDHENYPPLDEATMCGDLTIYYSPEELIAMSNAYGGGAVLFGPGEYYKYTNTNFTILSMIAQQVTGKSYRDLINELIVVPLGLTGTSAPANDETVMPSPYTHGYDYPGGREPGACYSYTAWRDYSVQNMSWDLGAGSIVSTAADLLRFMKAIYTGELISASMREQMFTPPAITDLDTGTSSKYGLGIDVINSTFIGHEGANSGYNTIIIFLDGYYYSILVSAGGGIQIGGEQITTSVSNILHEVNSVVMQ